MTSVTCTLDCDELYALVIACSVVQVGLLADSQKVMLTTPLALASALRLQLGRLAAPAGAAPPTTTAEAVAAPADVTKRAAATSLVRRVVRMPNA